MTDQQKTYFEKLYQTRNDTATALMNNFAVSNMWDSIVQKYSDQAHFIYELLQNADDSKATKSAFELKNEGLYFKHNGTKQFWISNPETEKEDQEKNQLGDINAITAVAQSNKDQSSIGKFGVGFKAVFQYTETPHIYDPNFCFKIERFIVPVKLENDLQERKTGETVFYFPFDKEEMPAEQAYSDILEKLKKLVCPTLFLSNLQEVSWKTDNESGAYLKDTKDENTVCQTLELLQKVGTNISNEKIILFTRSIENQNHTYSIGYFLNEKGKLTPKNIPAFCFFPTKEVTNLSFIIHAPFLLTDSREGIKHFESHNKEMVILLAQLAADSFLILKDLKLIDDDIIKIIPCEQPAEFFKPFYEKIKETLQTEDILPSLNGEYVKKENAYWAEYTHLPTAFSNEQLSKLTDNENAKWIFPTISRNEIRRSGEEFNYIEELRCDFLTIEKLINKINVNFINSQTTEWLINNLYPEIAKSNDYIKAAKTKPIFLDTENNAVAAFELNGRELHEILFLPTDNTNSPYKTIHPELLKNEKSKEFIQNFGIKKPSLKDEIYNHILPLYANDGEIDAETHFKKFFKYWKEEGRPEDIIDLIKDKEFVSYITKADGNNHRDKADEIYYPSDDLRKYFFSKPNTKFVDLENYYKFITDENDKNLLKEFLLKLGANELPRILEREITDRKEKRELNLNHGTRGETTTDKIIDGSKEIIENIDDEKSLLLWSYLGKLQHSELRGEHRYFYYSLQYQLFESTTLTRLKNTKWLLSHNSEFVAPHEITINELAEGYERNKELEELLGFRPLAVLTEEQQKLKFLEENNIDLDELKEFKAWKERQTTAPTSSSGYSSDVDNNEKYNSENAEQTPTDKTIRKIREKVNARVNNPEARETTKYTPEPEEETDEDVYTKPSIDFEKTKRRLEDKTVAEIEKLTAIEELTQLAAESNKYSFMWFKALLKLEMLESVESTASKNKEISIKFGKVELEQGTTKTLILSQPNRYIPPHIEEFSDVPIKFDNKSVIAESFSVKDYSLKAKLKSTDEIHGIDLTEIKEANISVKSADFLLEELHNCINSLKFQDDDDLKEKLPENLEFVFGPPGTGKTTYLAKNILAPMMEKNENCKILVLTPTNKAADVLSNRIMEQKTNFQNWLVRFGSSTDETIEKNGILKDRSFNLLSLSKSVVVTTIARFTYDTYVKNKFGSEKIYDIKWDYIVIDEASMIHLPSIIFALYKQKPEKFIIAGDPFQIGPIAKIKEWKDENIYTIIELDKPDSFVNPRSSPHNYHVVQLETQFRSVEAIGELFSKFTYNGKLKHNRKNNVSQKLTINERELKSLNFIKFPVSKYESIYKPKRLNNSSNYHIYSAILTFEFGKYIASQITHGSKKNPYRIGIISPYRIQADIVNKLIVSHKFPENIEIQAGTVHGYQGDECETVISLFNTPPKISRSSDSFVNKQNILNVAISRAKDYLFVLMPNNETEGIENLYKINRIEKIAETDTENYFEQQAAEIENIMFNANNYIEQVTFSTTHQNVNVYSEVEKFYEVRYGEDAIDIQIKPKNN